MKLRNVVFAVATMLLSATSAHSSDGIVMQRGDDIAEVGVVTENDVNLHIYLRNTISYEGICSGQSDIIVLLDTGASKHPYGTGCWQPVNDAKSVTFTILKRSGGSGYITVPTGKISVTSPKIFELLLRPDLTKTWEDNGDGTREEYYDRETRLWVKGRTEYFDKSTGKWLPEKM